MTDKTGRERQNSLPDSIKRLLPNYLIKFRKMRNPKQSPKMTISDLLCFGGPSVCSLIRELLPRLLRRVDLEKFFLRGGLKSLHRSDFTCDLRAENKGDPQKVPLFGERRSDGVHVAINYLIAVNRSRRRRRYALFESLMFHFPI